MQVSENLRRGIETTLVVLDEALCEFEQWANGREQRSVFYSERNTLSAAQREEIFSEVAGMREMLRGLQNDLGLGGRVSGAANAIWGKCAVLLISLEELKGKQLSRYGNPPRELVAYLDPYVERLIASINRIFRLMAESRI